VPNYVQQLPARTGSGQPLERFSRGLHLHHLQTKAKLFCITSEELKFTKKIRKKHFLNQQKFFSYFCSI
jgi:hypothetical protein